MKMYTAQEMRVRADYLDGALADEKTAVMLRQAAYNLEREATSEKSSQVGNAAAMRESLYAITRIDTRRLKRLLCELVEADIFDGGQISKTISAVEKARKSISAPPRDCDDLEVCSDYDETDEARREEREAHEIDKADAKRKGEW